LTAGANSQQLGQLTGSFGSARFRRQKRDAEANSSAMTVNQEQAQSSDASTLAFSAKEALSMSE
jgi:hypothetical protein